MKPEKKFWTNELRAGFRSMGDVDRIESGTSIGRPDVNFAMYPGISWDIELKVVHNNRITLRPSQRGWFSRRRRVAARAFVLTKWEEGDLYMLHFPFSIPDSDKVNDWEVMADHTWDGNIDWPEFQEILKGEYHVRSQK